MTAPASPYPTINVAILNQRSIRQRAAIPREPSQRGAGISIPADWGDQGLTTALETPRKQLAKGYLLIGLQRFAFGADVERKTCLTMLVHLFP